MFCPAHLVEHKDLESYSDSDISKVVRENISYRLPACKEQEAIRDYIRMLLSIYISCLLYQ